MVPKHCRISFFEYICVNQYVRYLRECELHNVVLEYMRNKTFLSSNVSYKFPKIFEGMFRIESKGKLRWDLKRYGIFIVDGFYLFIQLSTTVLFGNISRKTDGHVAQDLSMFTPAVLPFAWDKHSVFSIVD